MLERPLLREKAMPFVHLDDVGVREPMPGWPVRFVHSATMTFAHWTIAAGASLPEHRHPHEQVATILEGEFELTIDGETQVLRPGTVAIIPPDAVHAGRSLTPCRIIDAFHPVREDYR
jgi:quercetin dioxygenase-like cupin family protein